MPHTNPSSIANPDSGCNLKGPAFFNGVIFIGNADIAKAGQITVAGVMVVKCVKRNIEYPLPYRNL